MLSMQSNPLNPLASPSQRRMSDHVTPEIFARLNDKQLLQLAEPFVKQFERLRAANMDSGMNLAGFVRAAFVDEGLLPMDCNGQAQELPAALAELLGKIEFTDQVIADNLAANREQLPRVA